MKDIYIYIFLFFNPVLMKDEKYLKMISKGSDNTNTRLDGPGGSPTRPSSRLAQLDARMRESSLSPKLMSRPFLI